MNRTVYLICKMEAKDKGYSSDLVLAAQKNLADARISAIGFNGGVIYCKKGLKGKPIWVETIWPS